MDWAAITCTLSGIKVVDLGRGMSSAIAGKLLAELGASVERFEPAADEGHQASADPFYGLYPAYAIWHKNAHRHRVTPADPAIGAALAQAELCIVNGEDFPGYGWSFDATAIAARHPHLVILEIEGYPADCESAGRPAVEWLVQARSGLSFEQYGDRPNVMAYAPGSYGAALNGLTAAFAALCQKERDGRGQIVRSSLLEGMLMLASAAWLSASRPTPSFRFALPKSPHFLIFKCRDGRYLHFTFGSAGAKGRLYRILGIDDPAVGPEDAGMPNPAAGARNFFGDIDLLASHVIHFDSTELFEKITAAGIGVSYVLAPGECWDQAQVRHAGIIAGDAEHGRHVGLTMHGVVAPLSTSEARISTAISEQPLAGLRVIDFGIFVAGPLASVPLADLGADVIKVEALLGDPLRSIPRSFAAANRGKRAIAIDMKTPEGMEIAARLCASAHVIHSNFRPGVSARLGVDPKTQHARDPDKIVLETSAWGRSGTHAERPGFDMIFQAFCGHEMRGGGHAQPPMCDRLVMVDTFAGALGTLATMVAVWRRARGAGGADLELSLLDSGLFLLSELIEPPQAAFVGAPLLNAAQTGFHPAESLYACADGWIAICARGDAMTEALADTLGLRLRPRALWDQTEYDAIASELISQRCDEARRSLEKAGIWTETCSTIGERLLDESQGRSAALVMTAEHPQLGTVSQIGSLFRLAQGRRNASRVAPVVGADTRDLLTELGYSDAEIQALYERSLVA